MCGLVVFSQNVKHKQVKKSLDSLLHRGPDETSLERICGDWFGFQRLSIQDLSSRGMQPFQSQEFAVVCNGEIYNEK